MSGDKMARTRFPVTFDPDLLRVQRDLLVEIARERSRDPIEAEKVGLVDGMINFFDYLLDSLPEEYWRSL